MHHRPAHQRTAWRRSAFTLLDLAAVLLGVGIVGALILPATVSRGSTPVAKVSSEVRQLEAAFAQFHNVFGATPPSSVTLYEVGGAWDATSTAKIRRLWPNFDFTLDRDFDGDGESNANFELCGPECLVFFLGGMPVKDGETLVVAGFSKKPNDPFSPLNVDLPENRDGPYYEFESTRLHPSSRKASPFLVYVDSLPGQTMPYLYASSYDGQGYVTSELNVGGKQVLGDGVYQVGNTGKPQKPKGFQIISPGMDHQYGEGGPYDRNETNGLLSNVRDYDNITNFSTGQLVPGK